MDLEIPIEFRVLIVTLMIFFLSLSCLLMKAGSYGMDISAR